MSIPCKERVEHRPSWVVLDLDWCRSSAADLGQSTPGRHTVACQVCHVAWRSTAKYARELPYLGNSFELKLIELCREHPLLAELTYHIERDALVNTVTFLISVAEQLVDFGKLSPRQIEIVERIVAEHVARETNRRMAEQAHRERLRANGLRMAPEGRLRARGTVARAWMERFDHRVPSVPKMIVNYGDWTSEGTVPAGVARLVDTIEELVGRTVELDAYFRRKEFMSAEAWASRPSVKSCLVD